MASADFAERLGLADTDPASDDLAFRSPDPIYDEATRDLSTTEALWGALQADGGRLLAEATVADPAQGAFGPTPAYAESGRGSSGIVDDAAGAVTATAAYGETERTGADHALSGLHQLNAASPDVQTQVSGTATSGSGELWYSAEGSQYNPDYQAGDSPQPADPHGDDRIGYLFSDGSNATDEAYAPFGTTQASETTQLESEYGVGLDTANNLYFGLTQEYERNSQGNAGEFIFYDASISTGAFAATTTSLPHSLIVGQQADEDQLNGFGVDYVHHMIYLGIDSGEVGVGPGLTSEIVEISYNPSTGALSTGYNQSTDTGGALITNASTAGFYNNGSNFFVDPNANKLYYVDYDSGAYSIPNGYASQATDGVYVVSTTGSNPQPTLLSTVNGVSDFSTMPNGSGEIQAIAAMTVDIAKGYIYVVTDDYTEDYNSSDSTYGDITPHYGTAQDAIYAIPIGGGAATKLTLPNGVTLGLPGDMLYQFVQASGLALDADSQTLYVIDQANANADLRVVQLVLNSAGTGFVSGNNDVYNVDANGSVTNLTSSNSTGSPEGIAFASLPVLSVAGSVSFTSGDAVAPSASLVDYDSEIASATVAITGGFKSGDTLGDITAGDIVTSYNAATGVLTLTGVDTAADYQQVLESITYTDGATEGTGSHPTRTLTWTVYDGEGGNPVNTAYNQKTTTLTLDRAPVQTTHDYAAVVDGNTLFVNVGDTDPDGDALTYSNLIFTGASTGVYAGEMTASLSSSGAFMLSAPEASIQSAPTGSHPTVSLSYLVSDGTLATNETIDVTLDRAPVAATHTVDLAENASSSASSAIDSDPDGDALTVTAVTGGTVGSSLAGQYGHLTLNSNDTYSYVADNTAAITGAATGSHPVETFTYQVGDGLGGTSTETLQFVIDRAPIVTAGATVAYTEGAGPTPVDSALTLSDPDGDQIASATVAILGGFAGGDQLVFANQNGITGSYNSNNGVLSLSGGASQADYQAALDSISFSATPETVAAYQAASGGDLTRTLYYTASDGTLTSATATSTVDVSVVIADTAADLSAAFDSLNGDAAVSAIQITDNQALSLTQTQFTDDTTALSLIAGAYDVTVSGVTGQAYTGFTADYDAGHLLTSETLTGYTGRFYSYATVTYDAAGQVTGATYYDAGGDVVQTLVQTNNPDGSFERVLSGFSGRPYTEVVKDFDSSAHLTGATFSGYTTKPYTEIVKDFGASGALTSETFSGYTGAYTAITDTFDGSGRIATQAYDDGSNHLLQLLTRSYTPDGAYSVTASDVAAGFAGYTGFVKDYSSTGVLQASTVYGTGGIETDRAYVSGIILSSDDNPQNQFAVDGDTFVIGAGSGPDRIHGYTGGNETFDISSALFADFADLMTHAHDDGMGDTRVADGHGDSFLLIGITTTQLASHSSDFYFV